MQKEAQISESTINVIAEGSRLEGKIWLKHISRVHGTLVGDVHAVAGSVLVLKETSVVEGNIHADTLYVDGYVKGDIRAGTKVVVSGSGRVIGKIQCPSITIDFGAFFEGQCIMESVKPNLDPEVGGTALSST
ncbi:polymer-forming cytoskeletal protein [bacterium]|jgi:cytoskeletal protein CcmA (bactofilin family)|nr:polymer-forming cytoskeletal protein [bacterium]